MATSSAADVKRLRELTAAGMMDCKKALQEAEGDFDQAIEILRLKGAKDVGKRQQRSTSNGLIEARTKGTELGVLLGLDCETDFVAKNERFRTLGARLAEHIATTRPATVSELLESSIGEEGSVQQLLDENNAALGEKVKVGQFAVFDNGYVASYLHRTNPDIPPTIGALVELDGEDAQTAKDLVQHIAAAAPRYLTREEVPAEVVRHERELAEQMARDEGKPDRAVPKVVDGREAAFYKDFVLLEQMFVKDNKQSIASVLQDAGLNVRRFVRFQAGES